MKNILKYLLRVITLPLVLLLSLIWMIKAVLAVSRDYLMYGGEFVRYNKETNSKTLYEVWEKMNTDEGNI